MDINSTTGGPQVVSPSVLVIEMGLIPLAVTLAFGWPLACSRWFARLENRFGTRKTIEHRVISLRTDSSGRDSVLPYSGAAEGTLGDLPASLSLRFDGSAN